MITSLTAEQKARFPEFIKKWIAIGLSTKPADRQRAEKAIAGLYRLANIKERPVIWLPCPISAALSAVAYAAIMTRQRVEKKNAVDLAVGSAVRSAVDSAIGSAVGSAVDSAIGSAVGSAVDSAVGSAVGTAVDLAVRSAVGSAVRSAVGSAVDLAVRSAVDSAVDLAVRSAVDSAVDLAVRSAIGSAVDSAVGSAVGSAVRSAVRSAVDLAVYSAVESAVDSAVGSAVGSAVDSAVDSAVGSAVDSAVRSAVRSAIGSAVDSAVYSAGGSAGGSAVRSAIGSAGHSFFGGSVWNAGYSAWADYFNDVCAISIDRNFLEMTASCGFYWMLEDVCFASERPAQIHRDQAGRLHCESAPAISYAGTGWGLYSWHGYTIPPSHHWIIADKSRLSAEAIEAEQNAELRRIMLEVYGFERFLEERKAKVIASDVDGNGHLRRLLSTRVKGETIRIVEVLNGSLEPDGTRRKFLLGAMPGATPHEAIAASYGIRPKLYREAVRT